jgi:hypothetical protein
VKFVTLKAYEKAGGLVQRDLFSQGDEGVFIQDIVLLESLVAKKLEKTARQVRKEGWKRVEIVASIDGSELAKWERRYPETSPYPQNSRPNGTRSSPNPILSATSTIWTTTSRHLSTPSMSVSTKSTAVNPYGRKKRLPLPVSLSRS